jgi:Lar family restriction alleviation protein
MSREIELKPCPFCGGKAELKVNHVYMDEGVCVHCTECNVHTKTTLYDCTYQFYHGEKNVFITRERAERDVTELWNRRADCPEHGAKMKGGA